MNKKIGKKLFFIPSSPQPSPPIKSMGREGKMRIRIILLILVLLCGGFYFYSWYHGKTSPKGMVRIPSGTFLMGSDSRYARPNERPTHKVKLKGFWIDQTDVTNAQFAEFVKATGYITTAERKPDWETLKVQLPPGTPKPPESKFIPGAMVFVGTKTAVPLYGSPVWWKWVPGANWRHPQGPGSTIIGKENNPVVQVSYEDAVAYAKWIGKRLPTEAEWEYAARGGLEQKTYAWGDEFKPQGNAMANTFSGKQFPIVDNENKLKINTTQVGSYPPNGYGLYDMTGNVWQWVADWYHSDAFWLESRNGSSIKNPQGPESSYDAEDAVPYAPKKVLRGGSFLCDENFCMSYRPSARRGVDPYTSMSHIGFRLAKDS